MNSQTKNMRSEWWAPLAGRWHWDDKTQKHLGPTDPNVQNPYGLILSTMRLRSGSISTKISFENVQKSAGRILFGYNPATAAFFSIGLGGADDVAYVLDEFVPEKGWQALKALGSSQNLKAGSPYVIQMHLRGQSVRLIVENIPVLEASLPSPLTGDTIGLFAWGSGGVKFEETHGQSTSPRAFVVMHFGSPFDNLYSDVIKPVAEATGLEAYRADDMSGPGIIIEDIVQSLLEAQVIIAEITPVNANVFYELGYAHALKKPTILLADRSTKLPFDVSSYRCIFYDNTIGGKSKIEAELKRHLESIMNGTSKAELKELSRRRSSNHRRARSKT